MALCKRCDVRSPYDSLGGYCLSCWEAERREARERAQEAKPVPPTARDIREVREVLSALIDCEVMSGIDPQARRVLMGEADALRAAIGSDPARRLGDRAPLLAAVAEARRVARMWGVTI